MAIQLIVGQGVTYNRIFLRKCARWSTVWDEATRNRLYDHARATLVDEGVSPWHLIQPVIEARMLALWGRCRPRTGERHRGRRPLHDQKTEEQT